MQISHVVTMDWDHWAFQTRTRTLISWAQCSECEKKNGEREKTEEKNKHRAPITSKCTLQCNLMQSNAMQTHITHKCMHTHWEWTRARAHRHRILFKPKKQKRRDTKKVSQKRIKLESNRTALLLLLENSPNTERQTHFGFATLRMACLFNLFLLLPAELCAIWFSVWFLSLCICPYCFWVRARVWWKTRLRFICWRFVFTYYNSMCVCVFTTHTHTIACLRYQLRWPRLVCLFLHACALLSKRHRWWLFLFPCWFCCFLFELANRSIDLSRDSRRLTLLLAFISSFVPCCCCCCCYTSIWFVFHGINRIVCVLYYCYGSSA